MEEESKISFFEKWKISIFGLEKYEKLAIQKLTKTILYLTILILVFAFFVSLAITYKFHETINQTIQYIDNNIETLEIKEGMLYIKPKDKPDEPIIIDETSKFNGKIIIDTNNLEEEQIKKYENDIKSYFNGILILKDKIIVKTNGVSSNVTILISDITNNLNIEKIEKQNVINFAKESGIYELDVIFYIVMYIAIFINFLATILLDAILYALIAYTVGIFTRIRLKLTTAYNIAVYSLTLPILLNLIYAIVNILTGFTIEYFSVVYMAITCIYIICAILIIKTDAIKKQMELSKIITEQEKIKQEMEEQERQRKEEEEREKVRKEDEEKRRKEKRRRRKK